MPALHAEHMIVRACGCMATGGFVGAHSGPATHAANKGTDGANKATRHDVAEASLRRRSLRSVRSSLRTDSLAARPSYGYSRSHHTTLHQTTLPDRSRRKVIGVDSLRLALPLSPCQSIGLHRYMASLPPPRSLGYSKWYGYSCNFGQSIVTASPVQGRKCKARQG